MGTGHSHSPDTDQDLIAELGSAEEQDDATRRERLDRFYERLEAELEEDVEPQGSP